MPTEKGSYSVVVQIGGTSISTDYSGGVTVYPASGSGPHSTHTADSLAIEGYLETFAIQAKDEFLNTLDSSLIGTNNFVAYLSGSADSRSGNSGPTNVLASISENSPNTNGRYSVSYMPEVAGAYTLNVLLRKSGGLLAKYYKNDDFSSDVVGNSSVCPSSMITCDCTQIDSQINFDWGRDPALSHTAFPMEYFSIRWSGEIRVPSSGVWTFYASAKTGMRVTIGGQVVIDAFASPSDEVSGKATLSADSFHSIVVEYKETNQNAFARLSWSSTATPKQIVPSSAFYHQRHLQGSPMSVQFYPGDVDPTTSTAAGSGLSIGTALSQSTFTIQARDTKQNKRYNSGGDNFQISIT